MDSFAIWHWLIVMFVIAIPIGGFVWANQLNKARNHGKLEGFGGWLLWLAIGICLSPFSTLARLAERPMSKFPIVVYGEEVQGLVLVILQIAVIVLMVRKSYRFVSAFYFMCSYAIFLPIFDALWSSIALSALSGRSFGLFAKILVPYATGISIAYLIGIGVWMLYVARSRRVANTFR